jgi:hypothetical protein
LFPNQTGQVNDAVQAKPNYDYNDAIAQLADMQDVLARTGQNNQRAEEDIRASRIRRNLFNASALKEFKKAKKFSVLTEEQKQSLDDLASLKERVAQRLPGAETTYQKILRTPGLVKKAGEWLQTSRIAQANYGNLSRQHSFF